MSVALAEFGIEKVFLVDDDSAVRESYNDSVIDLDLEGVRATGPFESLKEFIEQTNQNSNAAICDHKLTTSNYAHFDGAEAVAHLYQSNFPAILCTGWIKSNTEEIRSHKRFIPVLLNSKEIEPNKLESGFITCIKEFQGQYNSNRKPWRTLVSVEQVDNDRGFIYVLVPGWDPREIVSMNKTDLKKEILDKIVRGHQIFHAKVNIGAESSEELFFYDWESK